LYYGLYGRGTDVNYSEALRWFSVVAYERRASRAFVHLGDMYAQGLGVAKDMSEAIRHYRAVVGSELRAQLALARIYSQENGVNANTNEASRLYSSLAVCNHLHDDLAVAAAGAGVGCEDVHEIVPSKSRGIPSACALMLPPVAFANHNSRTPKCTDAASVRVRTQHRESTIRTQGISPVPRSRVA